MAQPPNLPSLILDLNTQCPNCKYDIQPGEMAALARPRCPKCGYSFPAKDRRHREGWRPPSKVYLVQLKEPSGAIQRVRADQFEMRDEHLVFVKADGRLAALFLLDTVESFNVMPT